MKRKHPMETSSANDDFLDVAIIGGGISGVYSAWRLMTSDLSQSDVLSKMAAARPDKKLRVGVYEGSDRIGGRLLSLTPPDMPHIRCELGGMRYMTSHTYVRSLVENKLFLSTHDLPVFKSENIAYVRGKRLRLAELEDPDKVPYHVDWSEAGLDPSTLITHAMEQLVPNVTSLNGPALQKLLVDFRFEGRPLSHYGFWNLVSRGMTHEAYMFAREVGGYDTAGLNWNAADTIRLNFDFVPGVQFKVLNNGYESLPKQLCREFEEAGGGVTHGLWLKRFQTTQLPDGSDGVEMRFVKGENRPGFSDEGGVTVKARTLVLAMPRHSLELLDQTGQVLDENENKGIHQLMQTVIPVPLFKVFACYRHPWWHSVGVTEGRSVTDLPVRQCYYWGVEGEQPGADPSNQNSVLLASYDDSVSVDFWAGLQDLDAEDRFQPRLAPDTPDNASAEWKRHRAPRIMIEEIHRQLQAMHGVSFAPEPYDAAYKDWGDDPYGGGVNFWAVHAQSDQVIPKIAQPNPAVPVYICGEAYSRSQGWAEGALETAELVLQQHLCLPAPDWITESRSNAEPEKHEDQRASKKLGRMVRVLVQ